MTDVSTALTAAPLIAAVQPYITAAVTTIVGIVISLAFQKLNQLTGIKVSADLVNQVKLEAQKEAGILVAASADNLASRSITLNDGMVKTATESIIRAIPTVVNDAHYSTDDVAREVTAAIGHLQAIQGPAPNGKSK